MLQGKRIHLRHVTEADLPLLINMANNPAIRGPHGPSLLRSPHLLRKGFAEDGFSSEDREQLLVCDQLGMVIGDVVHFKARRYAAGRELGWCIFEHSLRGQGYASEAAGLLVDYLFANLPINRLECCVAPSNIASQRVAEKVGFQREGLARGLMLVNGEYRDGIDYGLLRSDWLSGKAG
ncbi:MAG TPA: GNAT family protein [Burkholderiaceae bacterium]